MPKQDYIPGDDSGKAALFLHNRNNIATYFSRLAITAITPQVVAQAADALAFDFICTAQQTIVAAAQEATAAKNRLRDGDSVSPNTTVVLTFPTSPMSVPTAVLPGVVNRFRLFAKWIKSLPGYAPDIGEALKIIGDESTDSDPATIKPTLPLTLTGGHVNIGWKWDGLSGQVDAIEIHVDRGTGYVLLTIDTRPGYLDTEPFPATSAKWKYKAIWRKDDQRIGLWSDVSEITVG